MFVTIYKYSDKQGDKYFRTQTNNVFNIHCYGYKINLTKIANGCLVNVNIFSIKLI